MRKLRSLLDSIALCLSVPALIIISIDYDTLQEFSSYVGYTVLVICGLYLIVRFAAWASKKIS